MCRTRWLFNSSARLWLVWSRKSVVATPTGTVLDAPPVFGCPSARPAPARDASEDLRVIVMWLHLQFPGRPIRLQHHLLSRGVARYRVGLAIPPDGTARLPGDIHQVADGRRVVQRLHRG